MKTTAGAAMACVCRVPVIAALILMLASCAGLHATPDLGYSANRDGSATAPLRIVFDQAGSPYQASPGSSPTEVPQLGWYNFGDGFRLTHPDWAKGAKGRSPYNRVDVLAQAVADLRKAIAEKRVIHGDDLVVVFQIAGFSSSFSSSATDMRIVRERLNLIDPRANRLYVEVYWDSLYQGPVSFPAPVFYWFESLTYSNMAGQFGLRPLLEAVPPDIELAIIAKSRGAAVALSAFANPTMDEPIKAGALEKDPTLDFDAQPIWKRTARTSLVMFAPAVGKGHFGDAGYPEGFAMSEQLATAITHLSATYNTGDYATEKVLGWSEKLGSTEFNSNAVYAQEVRGHLRRRGVSVFQSEFKTPPGGASHDTGSYLNNADNAARTHCLFSKALLVPTEPPGGCARLGLDPAGTE